MHIYIYIYIYIYTHTNIYIYLFISLSFPLSLSLSFCKVVCFATNSTFGTCSPRFKLRLLEDPGGIQRSDSRFRGRTSNAPCHDEV